jgi:hypothetical protein
MLFFFKYLNHSNKFYFFLQLKAAPVSPPFTCSFDSYSVESTDSCNGVSFSATNQAKLTTLTVDPLPSMPSTVITDFTSIAGNTVSEKNCDIPFLYNNSPQYFCVLNSSRFICEVAKPNTFDICNLGN